MCFLNLRVMELRPGRLTEYRRCWATMKMEAARSSETSMSTLEPTHCQNPEDLVEQDSVYKVLFCKYYWTIFVTSSLRKSKLLT